MEDPYKGKSARVRITKIIFLLFLLIIAYSGDGVLSAAFVVRYLC